MKIKQIIETLGPTKIKTESGSLYSDGKNFIGGCFSKSRKGSVIRSPTSSFTTLTLPSEADKEIRDDV